MGQALQIPDSFKGKGMAQAFAGLNAQEDNLADGIGQSYGVIGYKGKVWSLRYRGERKNILRPDDGTPSAYLDVIILQQARGKSKSFFKDYKEDSSDRPTCASMDGIVPDLDVIEKQHDSCALCPKNIWKTDPSGRKGRECSDYKRLAVLILPTQTKPILGEPLMEPVFLRVPPDSLTSLAIMGETMSDQGHHYSSYITRITFDPNKAHPCMVFRPLQGLSDQEAPVVLELRGEPTVNRITGGDITIAGLKAVQTALAPPGASATGLTALAVLPTVSAPPVQTAPPVVQSSSVAAPTSTPKNGSVNPMIASALSGVAPPATPAPTVSPVTGLVATGFGGVNTASVEPPPQAATQTAADVGEPEESDADLDAKIAGLIKTR